MEAHWIEINLHILRCRQNFQALLVVKSCRYYSNSRLISYDFWDWYQVCKVYQRMWFNKPCVCSKYILFTIFLSNNNMKNPPIEICDSSESLLLFKTALLRKVKFQFGWIHFTEILIQLIWTLRCKIREGFLKKKCKSFLKEDSWVSVCIEKQ